MSRTSCWSPTSQTRPSPLFQPRLTSLPCRAGCVPCPSRVRPRSWSMRPGAGRRLNGIERPRWRLAWASCPASSAGRSRVVAEFEARISKLLPGLADLGPAQIPGLKFLSARSRGSWPCCTCASETAQNRHKPRHDRADLNEFVIAAGRAGLDAVLERERTRLVGPRDAHLPRREQQREATAGRLKLRPGDTMPAAHSSAKADHSAPGHQLVAQSISTSRSPIVCPSARSASTISGWVTTKTQMVSS